MPFVPIDGVPGFSADPETGELTDQQQPPSQTPPAPPTVAAPGPAPMPPAGRPAPAAVPPPAPPQRDPLDVGLGALAQGETAGGRDKRHRKTMVGPLKGETAAGSYGLMPSTIRSYLDQYPQLVRAFPELAAVRNDNDSLTTWVNLHPDADNAIGRVAWADHLKRTNGNPHQAAIMWRGGPDALDLWKRGAADPGSVSKKDQAWFDELDQYGKNFDVNYERSQAGRLAPLSSAPGPVVGNASISGAQNSFSPVSPAAPAPPGPPPHVTPAAFQPVGADAGGGGLAPGEDPNVDPHNPPPDWKPGRTFFGSMGVGPAVKSAATAIAGGNTPEVNNAPPPGPVSPFSDLGPAGNQEQQGPTPSGATLEESLRAGEPSAPAGRTTVDGDQLQLHDSSGVIGGAGAAPADPGAALEARITDVDKQVIDQVNGLKDWGDEQKKKLDSFLGSIKDGQVDPNHFWSSMSTGHRILAAIALGLGSVGAALTHGQNEAANIIHQAIQDDIGAQVHNLGRQTTLYSEALKQFGDERQARLATILGLNQVARSMVAELRALRGGKMPAGTQTAIAGLNAGVKAIDDRLAQLSDAFHGPIGSMVAAVPIPTKTRIARDTKGATDMAIADAMRTGRFSSELIDQIAKMTPNVDSTPQMQAAMLGAIRQHLVEKMAELQSAAAGGGGAAVPAQEQDPEDFESVGAP